MAVEGGYGSAAQFQLMAAAAQQATGQIGRLVQSVAAIQATVGTITFAARAFANLEQQLTLTNAVAEGTAAQFKQMQDAVQNASLAMKFSATEGANALYFLASAGLSVQQSVTALQGVMALAQATLTDVGTAADTVANALAAFQLQANQSNRVANLFSAAIGQTNADITKLAFAFRQVAPVASAMGLSIEQTTATLSALFNVGLRGEQAGTALRNILVNLANPTKEASEALLQMGVATQQTNGKARDLFDTLEALAKVNPSTSTLKTLVGADALAGIQALLNASSPENYAKKLAADKEYADRADAIAKKAGKSAKDFGTELRMILSGETGTNSAFEVAAKQMATLSGSFSTAVNAVTLLATTLGQQLAPSLTKVANAVTDMGVGFQGLSQRNKDLVSSLPLIAAGVYGLTKAYGPLRDLLGKVSGSTAINQLLGGTGAPGILTSASVFAANTQGNINNVRQAGLTGALGALGIIPPTPVFQQVPQPLQYPAGTTIGGNPVGGQFIPAGQARYVAGTQINGQSVGGRFLPPPQMTNVQTGTTPVPGAEQFRTNILGAVTRSVAALGAIGLTVAGLYEVGKLIYDYMKVDRRATSTVSSADVGSDFRRQIQAQSLTAADPYQREQGLLQLQKTIEDSFASVQAQREGFGNKAAGAITDIRALAGRISPRSVRSDGSSKVGNDALESLTNALLGEGGVPVDLSKPAVFNNAAGSVRNTLGVVGLKTISPEDLRQLQVLIKDYNDYKSNLDILNKTQDGISQAVVLNNRAIDAARSTPGYDKSKDEADRQALVQKTQAATDKLNELGRFNAVSEKFLQEYERASRQSEVDLMQTTAKMRDDPLSKFFANVIAERFELAKKVEDQADKAKNDIEAKFSSIIAGKGGIADMLSGADFFEMVKKVNDKGEAVYEPVNPGGPKTQSVASMIKAGGFSSEQILARYDAVVADAMSRLQGLPPNLQAILEKFTAANRKLYENAIKERELKEIQDLRQARSDASTNRQFVEAMRERLVSGQQEVFRQLVQGASEIDPGIALQQGLRELSSGQQNAQNQFRQFEEQFYQKFAPAGSSAETVAAANAQFEKYRASFNSSLKNLFQVQIGNLILEARNARARALDTLRSNKSDLEAQQAQIAQELYTYTGDPQFLAEAITSDSKQAVASADRAIASLRDRSRTLTGNIARLNASNGLDMPGVPEINVPQSTQTFQTEAVRLQGEANATLKSIEANTRAGVQTAANPGGTLGSTPGSLPSFARLPALSGDINDMVRQATAGTGISEDYLKRLIQIESGGKSDAYNKSGASGLLQFMPKTAQAYGLTNPFDPSASISAGVQLSLDNKAYLKKLLGRDPTDGELYLGHQQGAGGAGALLSRPNDLAVDVVGRKAVLQNGGTADMLSSDFVKRWTSQFGANDNGSTATKQQTAANVELSASQKDVVAQLQQLLKIDGDYSNKLPDLVAKMKERGATESQVAQVQEIIAQGSGKLVAASEAEIRAGDRTVDMLTKLKEAKLAYFNSEGMKQYNTWQEEGKYIDALGKSMERTGSVTDGLQYAMMKARHNVQTDFQLAGDGLTTFMDKGSGIIAGLITGTEKDWKASVASMLQDISNVILKALIMRALTGSMGGLGDSSGGGFLSSIFGSLGGGTNIGAGLDGASVDFGADITSLLASSKGNVFVREHSIGGIVGSKQYFPMAGGMVGSIAETGKPEAIMPLQRGKGGRLGVEIVQPSASTPVVPIRAGSTQVANQNNFQASFSYQGGGAGGNGGGGRAPDTQTQRDMERSFSHEMDSAFTRFVTKESAPGGLFHQQTNKYA